MSIRMIRQFRASRSSTIIALLFSIASGASSLAGGYGHASSASDLHANPDQASWQEKRERGDNEQLICAL